MTADPTNSPVPVPGWLPIETAVRTQARHHDLVEAAGIEVDAEMAPILEKLWSVGIETHQSCQGFPRDYSPARIFEVWTDSAWIGFNDMDVALRFMRLLVAEANWSHPGADGAIWLMPTGIPGREVAAGIVCFPPALMPMAERAAQKHAKATEDVSDK